jgi:hypothetical protein
VLTYQGNVYNNTNFNLYRYNPGTGWDIEQYTITGPIKTQHLDLIKNRAEKLFDGNGTKIKMNGLSIDDWLSQNGYPPRPDDSIAPITPNPKP